MKKFFTLAALFSATWVNAQDVYQIPNSDFEGSWTENERRGAFGTYTETTPESWNSFYTANDETGMAFLAGGSQLGSLSNSSDPHSGKGAAVITSKKNAMKSISNGNLTTGIVNMGSTTAADQENYNFSDMSSETGCCKFTGLPDAVRFWIKFDSKDASKGNASANMILHTDAGYSDPSTRMGADAEAASRIAKAYTEITPNNSWVEYVVPFVYNDNNLYQTYTGQKYMLASFSTNKNPGEGNDGDALTIDDIQMVYYSELASLKYDGKDYFKEGVTNFTIDAGYDESKLSCTSNGKGATIEMSSYNEETAVLTITVKGNDVSVNPSNVHTYTVQFNKPVVTTYTNSLLVNAFGNYTEPTENSIDLIKETDDSYSLQLKNFAFGGNSLGDIKIVNLNREEESDAVIYSAENQMVYVGGFIGGELPITMSATQKGDELTADIHITLQPGANVDVTFLPALTVNGEDKLAASADRYNVTMNRTFAQGWSTICLPFATTPAALGATSVQELVSADENGLNFAEVETMEANKPYLIYFDAAKDAPIYFPAEITSTTPVAVTKGDYTFVGSYEASISMSGKYGVATIDGTQKITLGGANSTLKATRAYITKAGEKLAQVRINLYTSATTGIDEIENNGAQVYDVYSLQGVQVLKGATSLEGLQKGIYIVNGKKMIIK